MPWNPSPQVAAAHDFAKKFSKQIVIIISIDGTGRLEYTSYGETKKLCGYAKEIADIAFDVIREAQE